ncbi:hypothetical protein CYMTET_39718 [Cymbomonas tetramitiformis]|uniref:Uncharacterized protein n=1 Tax=Cymbomonas tetramitiformis TaxID=36881 RepID=A0AAE0F479_9CHLO|nr:hypothetical protein CYMTET_39718 [Cymbomonas tetramitiformis]
MAARQWTVMLRVVGGRHGCASVDGHAAGRRGHGYAAAAGAARLRRGMPGQLSAAAAAVAAAAAAGASTDAQPCLPPTTRSMAVQRPSAMPSPDDAQHGRPPTRSHATPRHPTAQARDCPSSSTAELPRHPTAQARCPGIQRRKRAAPAAALSCPDSPRHKREACVSSLDEFDESALASFYNTYIEICSSAIPARASARPLRSDQPTTRASTIACRSTMC